MKTQRELADKLKLPTVSNQVISNYERGAALPKDGRLALIAQALEVPVEYFFKEPEPPEGSADLIGALNGPREGDQEGLADRLDRIEQSIASIAEAQQSQDRQNRQVLSSLASLQKLLEQAGKDDEPPTLGITGDEKDEKTPEQDPGEHKKPPGEQAS